MKNIGHLGDAIQGQLGDVDQPVGSADVHESSVAGDAGDRALDGGPGLKPAEQLLALACAILVLGGFLADDEAVGLAVYLENLHRAPLAAQRLPAPPVSPPPPPGRQATPHPQTLSDQP